MKKINLGILTAASVLVLSASAMADNHLGGGFQGPSAVDVVTVEQASKMKDESQVILRGNIESSLGDEKYLFKDKTGSIRVEIDDDDWKGLVVKPTDTVEIEGEVDSHLMKPNDIDVESISLVK